MNSLRFFQKRQLVVQFDPGLAGLGQHDPVLAGRDVGKQQIEPALIAALALHRQRFAVGQPVDPGEIDILIAAEIDPGHGAGLHVDDAQADERIGPAGVG